jgi:hypothetical protein
MVLEFGCVLVGNLFSAIEILIFIVVGFFDIYEK